jgi:Sec-independent protein translocase protein TatA
MRLQENRKQEIEMGVGGGFLLLLLVGFIVLGPEQMHKMLGQLARTKAQFDKATQGLKSELAAQMKDGPHSEEKRISL